MRYIQSPKDCWDRPEDWEELWRLEENLLSLRLLWKIKKNKLLTLVWKLSKEYRSCHSSSSISSSNSNNNNDNKFDFININYFWLRGSVSHLVIINTYFCPFLNVFFYWSLCFIYIYLLFFFICDFYFVTF